jgi:hypothetical protein
MMQGGGHAGGNSSMHLHMSAPPATQMSQMSVHSQGGGGSNAHRKLFQTVDNGQVPP